VTELYRLTTSLNPLRDKVKVRTFLPSLSDFRQRLAFEVSEAFAMCLAGTGGADKSLARPGRKQATATEV